MTWNLENLVATENLPWLPWNNTVSLDLQLEFKTELFRDWGEYSMSKTVVTQGPLIPAETFYLLSSLNVSDLS